MGHRIRCHHAKGAVGMTFYNLKGLLTFWLLVAAILWATLSGDFGEAGRLIPLLLGGMALYWVGRWMVQALTGFDPHTGTTRTERRIAAAQTATLPRHEQRFACPHCHRVFKTATDRRQHMTQKHPLAPG